VPLARVHDFQLIRVSRHKAADKDEAPVANEKPEINVLPCAVRCSDAG